MQDSIPTNLLSNDDGSNYWGDPEFTYTGSVESFYFIYNTLEAKSASTNEDRTVQLYNGDYQKISPTGVTVTKVDDFSIDDYEAYKITLGENYAYSGNISIWIPGCGYYGINTLSGEESIKNTIELRRKISTTDGKFNYIRSSYDIDVGYYTYKFMTPGKYRFVYNDTYVTVTVSKNIDRLVYTDEFDYYNNNYNLDDARYYDKFQYTVSTKDSGAIEGQKTF